MKKLELLAPAGNMEALKAAVLAGCDAVYIGGKFFGARGYAHNFTNEEMIEAIRYCHVYGVKVYVTMNTMVYESEIPSFLEYARFLHQNNVDAIIIQDIGAADLLKKTFPNLKLHASTQMHLHNEDGIAFAEEFGFERAVVARETPISLLRKMKENHSIQLEVFIHGALCMSYSGQCLMSSLLNGRSGNRGTCSQCCRMPYDLVVDQKCVNQNKYILSPKDLNILEYIGELIDLGIDSFKIEGRMKRKEYVYQVVKIYRQAIDSYIEKGKVSVDEKEIEILKTLFNREFTRGFLMGEKLENFVHGFRPNHLGIPLGKVISVKKNFVTVSLVNSLHLQDGIRIMGTIDVGLTISTMYQNHKRILKATKGDIVSFYVDGKVAIGSDVVLTTSHQAIENIDRVLKQEKKIPISGKITCRLGEKIKLEIFDDKNQVCVYGDIVEKANTYPTEKEQIVRQIKKIGATPFQFLTLEEEIDENIFFSISKLNELRRNAMNELLEKRAYKISFVEEEYHLEVPEVKESCGSVVSIKDIAKIKELKGFDEVIVPYSFKEKVKNHENMIIKLPRVLEKVPEVNGTLLLGELGSVYHYKNGYTDFSLNVANSYTVAYLHSIGIKRVTLSLEANDYQIKNIIQAYKTRYGKEPNVEVLVSYTPEAMILKYDLLAANGVPKKEAVLRDYQGRNYQVVKDTNTTTIYHYERLTKESPNHYFEMGISKIRFEL